MSRNGSGTYSLPAGNPVVTGTTITTTWANTTLSDIASSLTGSVAADGQTPMSGTLNMANNKVSAVLDPTSAQDAATKTYVDTANALSLLKASNLSDVANATTSRTNLSAAKSGANSDITSITGLTTALSVAQGGTGLTAPGTTGNILTSNGTVWVSSASTNVYVGQQSQVFAANGTFTIPSGITALKITVLGGGGGSGSATSSVDDYGTGGNGGGGGYATKWLTALTPANTLAVTVGAGGTAGSGSGGTGGTSQVASGTQSITTISATGGGGGISGGPNSTGAAGVGGVGSNGDINGRGGSNYYTNSILTSNTANPTTAPSSGVAGILGAGATGAIRSAGAVSTTNGSVGGTGLVLIEW